MLRQRKPRNGQKIPTIVGIETVNYCNSRCIFCPLFQGKDQIDRKIRPRTTMSIELFEKIFREIASWKVGAELIYLNVHGEPLLDQSFKERLAILKNFGLTPRVDLQTNGELLTPEVSAAIVRSGMARITLGFDGATPEVYESHRVGCHYELVLKNIADFVAVRKRLRGATRLAIQYVRTKRNVHEVAAAYHLFRELLDPSLDCFQDNISKNWASKDLESSGVIWEDQHNFHQPIPCPMIDNQLNILADGSIAACCWDYNFAVFGEPLGNAREEAILAGFNGTKFNQLRNILNKEGSYHKPARCLSCRSLYLRDELTVEQATITDTRLITISPGGFAFTYSFQPRNPLRQLWTKFNARFLS